MRSIALILPLLMFWITSAAAQSGNTTCKSLAEDPHFYDNFHLTIGNGFYNLQFIKDGSIVDFHHEPYRFTVTEHRPGGDVAFVFTLKKFDGHTIELFDPFRNVWLLLDYCDMYVKYKDKQTDDYRNLYELTYNYSSLEDGASGGTLSAPFNVEGKPIVLLGLSAGDKENHRALMKLPDGRWGEFAYEAHGGTCCGFTSEGGRGAGGARYMRLTVDGSDYKPKFLFDEVSVSDQVMHLRDETRGVDLHVDLKSRNVMYRDANNPSDRLLWMISSAYSEGELIREAPQQ